MQLLRSDKLKDHVQNIIHDDTQLHETRIDLTVDKVSKLNQAGSLDFGGSEFEPAVTDIIKPRKKNDDDDYGWWNLEAGSYKAQFNEELSLNEKMLAIMNLHYHARQAGIRANSQLIEYSGSLGMVFDVPEVGCNIKENARFASLYLLEG